jgi:hypothetical protein
MESRRRQWRIADLHGLPQVGLVVLAVADVDQMPADPLRRRLDHEPVRRGQLGDERDELGDRLVMDVLAVLLERRDPGL